MNNKIELKPPPRLKYGWSKLKWYQEQLEWFKQVKSVIDQLTIEIESLKNNSSKNNDIILKD